MKNKKAVGVAVASALALALCGGALVGCGDEPTPPKKLTDEALTVNKIADFETGEANDRKAIFATDGFENGDVFNTWWNSENVSYDNGMAELTISEMAEKEQKWNPEYDAEEAASNPDYNVPQYIDCQAKYYGGEMRSSEYYGYGDYEVCMKPSNVNGTASTFFVCTGDYDVNYETKVPNPHDEVDIEFLGKDTTKVQFNYFVDDVGGHEYLYNLGFDASKEFHTYGFRWTAEYIVWFVDGKPVYKVEATKKNPMPSTPGRILTNYWTGTTKAEKWMGKFGNDYSGKAQYKYISTNAEAQPDPTVAPPTPSEDLEVPEDGWTDIDYSGFGGWKTDVYTVDKSNGLNISHSNSAKPGSYYCEGMSLASNYSWVKFKVKNNSEENDAVLRVDIKKETPSTAGIVGVASEHEGVSFLSGDGAALIELAAGEEAEVACKISDKVTVNQLVVFLNSTAGATATAGDITISELKGIEAEAGEDPGDDDPGNDEPSTEYNVVDVDAHIGDTETHFKGSGYNADVSEDGKTLTLSYKNIAGDSYKNVSGDVANIGDKNVFNVTIKNEGENTAKVRLDIDCLIDAVHKDCTFANLKAEYIGDIESNGNDYQYGGADWVKIGAGKTITAKITFKAVEIRGITFFVDSSTYEDKNKYTGKVVISDMSFSKEDIGEDPGPSIEDEKWDAINFEGATRNNDANNIYSFTATANSIHITHSAKPVSSSSVYTNVDYGSSDKVYMKIKNNLDAAYAMRVNVQSASAGYKTVITSAKIVGEASGCTLNIPTGENYDGITVNLAENAEIVLELAIGGGACNLCFGVNNMDTGAASGDVTISEISKNVVETAVVEPEPVAGTTLPEEDAGWIGLDLSAIANSENNIYTITHGSAETDSLNSVTISHENARCAQYGNVNLNVNYGTYDKLYMVIKNNSEEAATVKISVQNPNDGYRNTMSSATVTRENGTDNVSDLEWGATFALAAGEEVVLECTYNPLVSSAMAIVLNEYTSDPMSGSITVSKVSINKTASEETGD